MSPTTNLAMTLVLLVAACGADTAETPPTYSELYTRYFAPGTPGHCAMAGCHGDPMHNIWLCGTTKDTCYAGMTSVDAGLVNTLVPSASLIADPVNSPLSWVNPFGPMPMDTPGPFPEGRDAILAWIAAGAPND
jgi:hypothetical protein